MAPYHPTAERAFGAVAAKALGRHWPALSPLPGGCGAPPDVVIVVCSAVVMSDDSLRRQTPGLTMAEMPEHLEGNRCRCTGCRPTADASRSLCSDAPGGDGGGGGASKGCGHRGGRLLRRGRLL